MTGGFAAAIEQENAGGFVGVIPDIKPTSPKEGDLLQGRDPVAVAASLVKAGSVVLSVVTESQRFGGSPDLLATIAQTVNVPILRKDFLTSTDDIEATAQLGASAVLLMCAVLEPARLTRLYNLAVNLGLEPLVEVHTAAELAFADSLGAKLIGVNNRDILALETDDGGPSLTVQLLSGVSPGTLVISESGITSQADVVRLAQAGVQAVLVGTALWQADDMNQMLASLRVARPGARAVS